MNIRQITAMSLVLLCSFAFGVALGTSGPGPRTTDYEVAPMPPTEHLEWDQHQVGGFTLCQPDTEREGAEKGKFRCIKLPEGSVLSTPRWVKGTSDEDRRIWQ